MFFIIYLLKKYENHVDIIRQILTAAVNCLTINIHSFAQCERVLLPTNITKYELPRYGGGARMLPLLVHGVPRLRGARPSGLPAKHGTSLTIMSILIMSMSKYRQHEHIIALPVSALTWGRLGSSWRDGDPRSDRIAHHISPGETLLQHLAQSLLFDFPLFLSSCFTHLPSCRTPESSVNLEAPLWLASSSTTPTPETPALVFSSSLLWLEVSYHICIFICFFLHV